MLKIVPKSERDGNDKARQRVNLDCAGRQTVLNYLVTTTMGYG